MLMDEESNVGIDYGLLGNVLLKGWNDLLFLLYEPCCP